MKHRVSRGLSGATLVAVGLLAQALGGCAKANKLETGYAYTPLMASPAEIRGYYAERFTPESRAASVEREQEMEARRPKPGY